MVTHHVCERLAAMDGEREIRGERLEEVFRLCVLLRTI
jgi:hypothetical protein